MDWAHVAGSNIKTFRTALGLSQEELAFRANIDVKYLRQIEQGSRNPSLSKLISIASELNVALPELFHWERSPSTTST